MHFIFFKSLYFASNIYIYIFFILLCCFHFPFHFCFMQLYAVAALSVNICFILCIDSLNTAEAKAIRFIYDLSFIAFLKIFLTLCTFSQLCTQTLQISFFHFHFLKSGWVKITEIPSPFFSSIITCI